MKSRLAQGLNSGSSSDDRDFELASHLVGGPDASTKQKQGPKLESVDCSESYPDFRGQVHLPPRQPFGAQSCSDSDGWPSKHAYLILLKVKNFLRSTHNSLTEQQVASLALETLLRELGPSAYDQFANCDLRFD